LASHASALKAHRQNVKQREHNRQLRSRLRTALKSIRLAAESGDTTGAKSALNQTVSLIDKMAAKKIIHRNAAARHKARLSKRLTKKAS